MSQQRLIVSLHDVSPLTRPACESILDDLARVGCRAVSLLVIPNHHGKAPIRDAPGFDSWVRDRVCCGDEAVLHGYYHLREKRAPAGWWASVVANHYTAGEGEFFDLTKAAATDLLSRGRADFEACGLKPTGFIAPAWLLGEDARRAVEAAGFAYTTRLRMVEPLGEPPLKPVPSQSLVWSTRAAWRRLLSLGWNRLLFHSLAKNPVLRIGLHPPDWSYPAIRQQILALTRAALAGRRSITYENWVLEHAGKTR